MTTIHASEVQTSPKPKLVSSVRRSPTATDAPKVAELDAAPVLPTPPTLENPPAPKFASGTKAALVLKKLGTAKGATMDQLKKATNWQAHSVRGFLSGIVRKKLSLTLVSEIGKDGLRRYRTEAPAEQ